MIYFSDRIHVYFLMVESGSRSIRIRSPGVSKPSVNHCWCMVPILDGNPEIGAHVRRNLCSAFDKIKSRYFFLSENNFFSFMRAQYVLSNHLIYAPCIGAAVSQPIEQILYQYTIWHRTNFITKHLKYNLREVAKKCFFL